MNCKDAVAALVASLENGTPMTAEQREHIRTCERCRELLDSARQFETLLGGNGVQPPKVDAVAAVAETEIRRAGNRRTILVALAIVVVAWAAVSALLIRAGEAPPAEAMAVSAAAIGIGTIVALPFLLIFWFARSARGSGDRLYKRLKPGRQISGVCLGLAERFNLSVTLVRVIFLAALFAEGLGFWVYLILDLAMPVHPDDRQHLLRFRIRRWFGRRTHATNNAP